MDARASPISTADLRNRPTESGRRTLKKALARRVRHSSAYRLRELAGLDPEAKGESRGKEPP